MRRQALYSIIEIVLSFIGTGIAGTIYFAHRASVELPCSTGNGCDLVNASHWAYVYGVPVALIGLVGYAALVVLAALKLYAETARGAALLRALMLVMTLNGTLYSWYLQYVAAVYIGATCIWCRSSAVTMSLLLITLVAEYIALRKSGNGAPRTGAVGAR